MTTEKITTATVALAYNLAFTLNLDSRVDGDPCNTAFRLAHGLLQLLTDVQRGDRVHSWVVSNAEYDVATLEEFIAKVTPNGCKCEACVEAHLNENLTPLRHGVRCYSDGEVHIQWAVFTEEQVRKTLYADDESLASVLTGWYACNGGPGQAFAGEPELQRGKFHTLVTQRCGFDV